MTVPRAVPEHITDPRHRAAWELLAAGTGISPTAKSVGVARSTISEWVRKWKNDLGTEDLFGPIVEAARRQTAKARAVADLRWVETSVVVEAKTAETLVIAIDKVRELIEAGDLKAARDIAVVFGILTDKVQLISGAATSRPDLGRHPTPAEVDAAIAEMFDSAKAALGVDGN